MSGIRSRTQNGPGALEAAERRGCLPRAQPVLPIEIITVLHQFVLQRKLVSETKSNSFTKRGGPHGNFSKPGADRSALVGPGRARRASQGSGPPLRASSGSQNLRICEGPGGLRTANSAPRILA